MGWLASIFAMATREQWPDVPGLFRPTTRQEAVERARKLAGPAGAKIRYRLADHQGGRDPHAPDCASHWKSAVKRIPLATADCAALACWSIGMDRYQPDRFSTFGGWLNTDSMLIDARTSKELFEIADKPTPGDLIVYPSIDYDRDGDRERVGHVGIVVDAAAWVPGTFGGLRVVHCSAGNDRRLGRAIAETDAAPWAGAATYRGETRPAWGAMFLRYRRFVPS